MPDTVVYFDSSLSVVDAAQGELAVVTATDAAQGEFVVITAGEAGLTGPAGATGPAGPAGSGGASTLPTNITFADTPYAVLAADYAVFANTSGGDIEVDLPASPVNGRLINVKKVSTDANDIVVDGNGKTIDGSASITSAAVNRPNLQLLYDSSANDWRIL